MSENAQELQRICRQHFSETSAYRNHVWQVLTNTFFSRWIPSGTVMLDLGCGYGEFINNIAAGENIRWI